MALVNFTVNQLTTREPTFNFLDFFLNLLKFNISSLLSSLFFVARGMAALRAFEEDARSLCLDKLLGTAASIYLGWKARQLLVRALVWQGIVVAAAVVIVGGWPVRIRPTVL